jgi:cysteine dioxygenase
MNRPLDQLLDYLDHLEERAALPELTARLAETEISYDDVADFVRFTDRGYARNLVRRGEHYALLVLCWKNGQRSPIHDHHGSSCAVRVLRGTATETLFEFAPNGHLWAVGSRQHRSGSVVGSQDSDVHQISNLQAGDADLVTVHVYSPPLMWMGTYTLYDTTRGQEPMLMEFSDAAGI